MLHHVHFNLHYFACIKNKHKYDFWILISPYLSMVLMNPNAMGYSKVYDVVMRI
jgi:hypothetical protein